jgi:hypothetical protein
MRLPAKYKELGRMFKEASRNITSIFGYIEVQKILKPSAPVQKVLI